MRHWTPKTLIKIAVVGGFIAFCAILLAVLAPPAECQGKWCPPIDCYGGDCAECVCIRDSYPAPGFCASLD